MMTMHELCAAPPKALQESLAAFEKQFFYPLGEQSFRIEHGNDYSKFCLSMGSGCCFVYEEDGEVLGTLAVSLRAIKLPNGTHKNVAYICDAKVSDIPQRGYVLLKLAKSAIGCCTSRTDAAFAVVMDGTSVQPDKYTGRLGIPAFNRLGTLSILRILSPEVAHAEVPNIEVVSTQLAASCATENAVRQLLDRLGTNAYVCSVGRPEERSTLAPIWLASKETACGCLEDTGNAKLLITREGAEIRSAHLSSFGYEDIKSGAELIRYALTLAKENHYPAMFVAVCSGDAPAMKQELRDLEIAIATATIFGCQLECAANWIVNTSEI